MSNKLQYSKALIEKEIANIINNHVKSSTADCEKKQRYKIIRREDISYCLVDDGVDKYNDLIKQIQKQWNYTLSENYVDDAIKELIADAIKDGHRETTSQHIDQLVAAFENDSSQRQTVYLPLAAIQMEFDTFEIGRFALKKINDGLIGELSGKIRKNFSSIIPLTQVKTLAEYHTVAERGAAEEFALRDLQGVTDLLIYCAYSLYSKRSNIAARLQGSAASRVSASLVISSDGSYAVNWPNLSAIAFEISARNIEKMNELGFSEVSHILKKSNADLKKFERTLLRGIHWFALSQVQYEKAAEFICLTTCLETFLNPRDDSPKQTSIAEGTAILLNTTLEGRQELKGRVKDIYRLRSAVIHGDEPKSLDTELPRLRSIAAKLVRLMIERHGEFNDQKDLVKWIDDSKLRPFLLMIKQ